MSEITTLIEALMRQQGLSQAELASRSGLHRSNLCRFLAGETDVRMSSLLSLLAALGLDFKEYLQHELNRRSLSPVQLKVDSIGGAIETLLEHSDSLTKRTLINTLMVRAQSAGHKSEVARALQLLSSHSAKLQERSH